MLNYRARSTGWWTLTLFAFILSCPLAASAAEQAAAGTAGKPWWFWPIVLFVFCLVLGILAVMAGVGGGVLYVPLVSGFFPFHIDFVRGVGLMVALAGALAAMMSETGTVAAVLGTDLIPPVVAFKEGYEAGAKSINPDINLISTYHPGGLDVAFTDP